MESNVQSNQSGFWTNERHLHFLNSMEASFVRTMFENNNSRALRLDRYLPDSSESTRDLKSQRTGKKHPTSGSAVNLIDSRRRLEGKERRRRMLSGPYNLSQDQVVPHLHIRTGRDKDEKDYPNAPIPPANC